MSVINIKFIALEVALKPQPPRWKSKVREPLDCAVSSFALQLVVGLCIAALFVIELHAYAKLRCQTITLAIHSLPREQK